MKWALVPARLVGFIATDTVAFECDWLSFFHELGQMIRDEK